MLTAETRDKLEIIFTLDEVVEAAGGVKCNFFGNRDPMTGWDKYLIVIREEWGRFIEVDEVMEPGCDIEDPYVQRVGKDLLKVAGAYTFGVQISVWLTNPFVYQALSMNRLLPFSYNRRFRI
jgi:hypothetical protein